jgi:hypothetical protein
MIGAAWNDMVSRVNKRINLNWKWRVLNNSNFFLITEDCKEITQTYEV